MPKVVIPETFESHVKLEITLTCDHCPSSITKEGDGDDYAALIDAVDKRAVEDGWFILNDKPCCGECGENELAEHFNEEFLKKLRRVLTNPELVEDICRGSSDLFVGCTSSNPDIASVTRKLATISVSDLAPVIIQALVAHVEKS